VSDFIAQEHHLMQLDSVGPLPHNSTITTTIASLYDCNGILQYYNRYCSFIYPDESSEINLSPMSKHNEIKQNKSHFAF